MDLDKFKTLHPPKPDRTGQIFLAAAIAILAILYVGLKYLEGME